MDLPTTLWGLAGVGGLLAFSTWRSMQPADPLKPRLVPWRLVSVMAGGFALMLLVHLVNLFGVETGARGPR